MLRKKDQRANGTIAKRTRKKIDVLLEETLDSDLFLIHAIAQLKRVRKWRSTFRNAIRLFLDLAEGRTDVLRELFPGIVEALARPPASEEYERMMAAIAELVNNRQVPVMVEAPRVRPTLDEFDIADLDDQPTQVVPSVNVLDNFFNSFEGYD